MVEFRTGGVPLDDRFANEGNRSDDRERRATLVCDFRIELSFAFIV